jgi:hypothetical protein
LPTGCHLLAAEQRNPSLTGAHVLSVPEGFLTCHQGALQETAAGCPSKKAARASSRSMQI